LPKASRSAPSVSSDSALLEEPDHKTGIQGSSSAGSVSTSSIPDSAPYTRRNRTFSSERDPSHRISFSSLYPLGSAVYTGGANAASATGNSSVAGSFKSMVDDTLKHPSGSPTMGAGLADSSATEMDPTMGAMPTLLPHSGLNTKRSFEHTALKHLAIGSPSQFPYSPSSSATIPRNDANVEGWATSRAPRPGRSSSRTPRRFSGSTAASSTSDAERMYGAQKFLENMD
jgi:hypothetical protein